jgi:hypothetical protein
MKSHSFSVNGFDGSLSDSMAPIALRFRNPLSSLYVEITSFPVNNYITVWFQGYVLKLPVTLKDASCICQQDFVPPGLRRLKSETVKCGHESRETRT